MTKPTLLNTRPIHQQQETQQAFSQQGFFVINCPCIEISAVDDCEQVVLQLNNITANDTLIFTSQNAVRYAFKLKPDWIISKNSIVIAIGSKTSQVLEQNYSGDIWSPQHQNSTGVIDLLKGINGISSIKLISAANGRTQIQKYAQDDGIKLQQINVYQRQLPQIEDTVINQIRNTNNLIVLATSVTTLHNLQKLTSKELFKKLKKDKIICASQRIQQAAKDLGFEDTVNCNTANPITIAEKCAYLIQRML